MASCILYQNSLSSVTIIDIPKSIEYAQGPSNSSRIVSSAPLQRAFSSTEPKSEIARAKLGDPSLSDLLIQKHLQFVLEDLAREHAGAWSLPRVAASEIPETRTSSTTKKRKRNVDNDNDLDIKNGSWAKTPLGSSECESVEMDSDGFYFENLGDSTNSHKLKLDGSTFHIPSRTTFLNGEILQTVPLFTERAPKFDLIIMDPPWPNRSARRTKGYKISHDNNDIHSLLSSIPIYDHLVDSAMVGIWITNKPAFRALVLDLFQEWGLTLVEEWVWLKVTVNGEPICALNGLWRKPYEVLLVAKRDVSQSDVKRRVIVGVPDLHSRKPNLKELFEGILGKDYQALEIFARNLTTGWWGWGNEVLKFQEENYWIEEESIDGEIV